MAASLAQLFSEQKEKETPYTGTITFTEKTISYLDNTLLLRNVSQFSMYGIIRFHRISNTMLIIAGVIAISSLFFKPYGLIALIPAAIVLYLGWRERSRPKLYGLTIELNSTSKHYFRSVDRKGISDLFATITKAVNQRGEFTVQVRYEDKRVIIIDSTVGIVGEGNTGNNIKQ